MYNTRMYPDATLDKIIEDLRGTCQIFACVASDYGVLEEDMTIADWQYIEEQIFCCNCCGWWCDVAECHDTEDGMMCDDCAGDDE